MILGQSAATAACLAMKENVSVQALPYEALRQTLLDDQQTLKWADGPAPTGINQWIEKKSHKQGTTATLAGV